MTSMTLVQLGLACLVCTFAHGNETQDKTSSPVFLQSTGAQDLQVVSSFAQDVAQKAEEVVGATAGTPTHIRLACSDQPKDQGKVDADLNFLQALLIDPSEAGCCQSLAAAVKLMAGEDSVFQNDEKDDAVAFMTVAAGSDSKISKTELDNLMKQFDAADKAGHKDGYLSAAERNAIISGWQGLTALGDGKPAKPGAPSLLPVGTLQACDIKGDVNSLSPLHFAPHLPFVRAVEIDTSNTCDELLRAILCFAGDDMLLQTNEMDAIVATFVINGGDLKLDEDEMKKLVGEKNKGGVLRDKSHGAGEDLIFQPEELKNYLGWLQTTLIPA